MIKHFYFHFVLGNFHSAKDQDKEMNLLRNLLKYTREKDELIVEGLNLYKSALVIVNDEKPALEELSNLVHTSFVRIGFTYPEFEAKIPQIHRDFMVLSNLFSKLGFLCVFAILQKDRYLRRKM